MWNEETVLTDEKARSLNGRDLLSIGDLSLSEINRIFEVASLLKKYKREGTEHSILKGKTLGMIFAKSSTRTRVSFEVATWDLGGYALNLEISGMQISRGEPIKDTARVLSRYLDGIMIRTYSHDEVIELASYASVPVINGLTDMFHPCQVLADLFTCIDQGKDLSNSTLVYVGDGNNVAHSLLLGASLVGMDISINVPEGYEPDESIVKQAKDYGEKSGSNIFVESEPQANIERADIIYTDVWASMGMEEEAQRRIRDFAGFQVNQAMLKQSKSDCIVMHCLPAHRGEEITGEVMEGPNSVVFDQAENRLHVQKAILALLL